MISTLKQWKKLRIWNHFPFCWALSDSLNFWINHLIPLTKTATLHIPVFESKLSLYFSSVLLSTLAIRFGQMITRFVGLSNWATEGHTDLYLFGKSLTVWRSPANHRVAPQTARFSRRSLAWNCWASSFHLLMVSFFAESLDHRLWSWNC